DRVGGGDRLGADGLQGRVEGTDAVDQRAVDRQSGQAVAAGEVGHAQVADGRVVQRVLGWHREIEHRAGNHRCRGGDQVVRRGAADDDGPTNAGDAGQDGVRARDRLGAEGLQDRVQRADAVDEKPGGRQGGYEVAAGVLDHSRI